MHTQRRPTAPGGHSASPEWPTLVLLAALYACWLLLTSLYATLGPWLTIPILALCLTLHSSLQHEIIHGHPTCWPLLNDFLASPALGLLVPYLRFRDMHLAHHRDPILTDPHEDPETNFLDPAVWQALPGWYRRLLAVNNTILGRMVLGPALGLIRLYRNDAAAILNGRGRIAKAYLHHVLASAPILAWLFWTEFPLLSYLPACYIALSILRIRTFLEHRAHEQPRQRSVIVEDRGPLALLFLNNNFHALHHAIPQLAWYRLPRVYSERREAILQRNGGYRYNSYLEVMGRFLVRGKDPVPHPLARTPGE